MKLMALVFSTMILTVSAFGDHAVDNAAETARAAYRAADDAESLASAANRDADWDREVVIESQTESHVVPEDQRDSTLREVARQANSLHYSLSDLYRAARRVVLGSLQKGGS